MSYPASAFHLRPLGIGDLLDEGIRLYRRHFRFLIGISLVPLAPLVVLQLLQQAATSDSDWDVAYSIVTLVYVIVLAASFLLMELAVTYGVSEVYLGARPTVRAAYVACSGRLGASVAVSILVFTAILLLAVTILGIPVAIYYGVAWSISLQVLMIEGVGIRRALGRSRALVRGHWWRVLAINLLLYALLWIVQMAFALPGTVLGAIDLFSDPVGQGSALSLLSIVSSIFGTAGQAIALPIYYCGLVLLYYDLRIRKEGFDLELLARQMEA